MEKRTKRMLLAILMIISVLATDFFVLGSGIITYASELNRETNNTYVEFSAYFKDSENRVDNIEKSIKANDVKLYAEIKVKNEGYLKEGTVIEIENSNFNLKNEILESNTHIKSIEGNKVNLKQINNGETIEIELGIEPVMSDKITVDYLSQTSTVKMIGSYVYSKAEEGSPITSEKSVCLNYQPDETIDAELETDIITNKVLSVNGVNQRIVQLLIKSRLANNEYPVKQTTLKATIPELSEEKPEISAIEINNNTKIKNTTNENGTVEIILSNDADKNNEISWNKNVYDEIVVTYVYPETVDTSNLEITTDSEIKVYNSEKIYTKKHTTSETEELSNVVIGKTEITTEELYKGKLYSNIDATYNTETLIAITNTNVIDEIVTLEGADVFGTAESEITANTKYLSTEVNLEKMLAILGQDGNIQIKNGGTSYVINKETETDENGNIIVNYENGTSELEITTSKPVNAGILELKHTKAITKNNYTRKQLQEVKTLNIKNITLAKLEGTEIVRKSTDTSILELKETISKAELTIENNKTALSTIEENEVTLGVTLVTNGEQYDLYKNPKISLKFPTAVNNVELISTPNKQNADEFNVNVGTFDSTNKTMLIELQGEQKTYTESELTQSYIQLNLNVTLEELALGQTDKIMMAYINENAVQYEGGRTDSGRAEQEVEISAPSQLIKMFNLSSNENTSFTETILQRVKENEAGNTLNFGISLINNKDSNINNLKILGKLPTTENTIIGQEENTLETILKGITAENSTIYYTENAKATEEIENTTNGWTTSLLPNAKLYLIKVDSLERGAKFNAEVTVQLPNPMIESVISYTQYDAIYDSATETNVKESSRKIGLATSVTASIKTKITAQVGHDIVENGDTVKEGEVIKYTVTVSNKGANTLENVQLKLDVPNGTTFVQPLDDYVYAIANGSEAYYEEIKDNEKLSQLTNITISQLTTTEPFTIQYEVRVNKGNTSTEIINKPIVIYDNTELSGIEFQNTIEKSNVRVTIKRTKDEFVQLMPGGDSSYVVYVENLSDSTLNNLKLQIIEDGFSIKEIEGNTDITETIEISEITPKSLNTSGDLDLTQEIVDGVRLFALQGDIDKSAEKLSISAIVKDSEGKTYRSNYLEEDLPFIGATINLSSPQNTEYVKSGDKVEYNIVVKNIGEIESEIRIKDVVSEHLEVQKIYLNNELTRENTVETIILNDIDYPVILKPQEQVKLDIITKVKQIPELYHGKTISNHATIKVANAIENNSQTVTHMLKADLVEENAENVISGLAWYDEDENGKRDINEKTISGISVSIYDQINKHYLSDEYGNPIQIIIGSNGEYNLKNIKDGSYLIVFEYDTEKYVLTTPYAENVNSSLNSKASIKTITGDRYKTRVAAIEINNLKGNMFDMNIGLKENRGQTSIEEQPGIEEIPEQPGTPDNPTTPDKPTNSEKPNDSETPGNTEKPEEPKDTKTISGFAWLDPNIDGRKDEEEIYLPGIKVRLYNISTKKFITDQNGNMLEMITDNNGKYNFNNIEKGSYIVIFEYDTEEYKLSTQNTNVVLKKVNINGQQITSAVTDVINVNKDISNINIGLKENLKFDLELNKYISKIIVQTNKETKTYNYEGKTLGKVEIHRKQIQSANVILEYTIKLKNSGEITGYAKNIVDYIPSGLTFSSELNTDWYLSGNNLYTKSLENIAINPGEEKEIKLILTKTMTNENVGLINNRAEIYQDYNKYGESDIDSIPNNQAQNEDDFGATDVIIQVATGGSTIAYIVLLIINLVLIYIAIRIMIKNKIIRIRTKEGRR